MRGLLWCQVMAGAAQGRIIAGQLAGPAASGIALPLFVVEAVVDDEIEVAASVLVDD